MRICPSAVTAIMLAAVTGLTFGCSQEPTAPVVQEVGDPGPGEPGPGDEGTGGSEGPRVTVAIVSGNPQSVPVGQLGEPLVVRVQNESGEPLADTEVRWEAGAGDVLLVGDGDSISYTDAASHTDADGLAQMSFIPTAFATVTIWASVHRYADCAVDCEESVVRFTVDAHDLGATFEIVSGDGQQATVGRLSEPLVVRVRDGGGQPVRYAAVHWSIAFGKGKLEGPFGEDGTGSTYTVTHTDSDGLASLSVMPSWFGPVLVDAGLTDAPPLTFILDDTDVGASLSMVSGDDQAGKVGEALAEPFVVRVTDSQGAPIPNALVDWSVVGGAGPQPSYTDEEGRAQVFFTPRRLGTTRVVAQPDGLPEAVTFTEESDTVVISYEAYDDWPTNYFEALFDQSSCGWDGSCWAYVPLGTPVEWVSHVSLVQIVSTSMPAGAEPFSTGDLNEDGRATFVPEEAGTWEFEDVLHRSSPFTLYVR